MAEQDAVLTNQSIENLTNQSIENDLSGNITARSFLKETRP